eukprot:TRINITY_DN11535_c0_g1_i1.p1 TRINITY_DN11535_c0_g1~~TRINITY_DN11535_c0_g1_i1.p1  ORF type:complete len:531 (-),score=133.27 TRINITY_DN11535_c0_g1_i1:120-1652(-)
MCIRDRDKTADEIAEEEGIPLEQAIKKSNALVIHGDMINEAMKADEALPESERGKKLASWLQKPQLVFARTSPAQKLIIVDGCQKLGHVVAVTGDGVNDSPAIKKADIGIAMGITGSDVAKDAADMILLSDDFSAIVIGVEEGRKIFDNLKKTISYLLISNLMEILTFLIFIVIQIPLPMTTVIMLCISIGTDMVPAGSFAYEEGELDIMTRKPRTKWEHLVTGKLMVWAYLQQGVLGTVGMFVTYFMVLQDFGFTPTWLPFNILIGGIYHGDGDVYDEEHVTFGNTNAQCFFDNGKWQIKDLKNDYTGVDELDQPDWIYKEALTQDLRMVFLDCDSNGLAKHNWDWTTCRIKQMSPWSERPICYTTEALKYAQTAVFFSVVLIQWSNVFSSKTRRLSIWLQGNKNFVMIFGIASETVFTFILAYIYPIGTALGTRDVIFIHYGLAALPVSILLMVHDEIRKWLIRHWPAPKDRPNWFERNSCWQSCFRCFRVFLQSNNHFFLVNRIFVC